MNPCAVLMGMWSGTTAVENTWQFLQNVKTEQHYDPAQNCWIWVQRNWRQKLRDVSPPCSYESEGVKIIQMPVNNRASPTLRLYAQEGISLCLKSNGIPHMPRQRRTKAITGDETCQSAKGKTEMPAGAALLETQVTAVSRAGESELRLRFQVCKIKIFWWCFHNTVNILNTTELYT